MIPKVAASAIACSRFEIKLTAISGHSSRAVLRISLGAGLGSKKGSRPLRTKRRIFTKAEWTKQTSEKRNGLTHKVLEPTLQWQAKRKPLGQGPNHLPAGFPSLFHDSSLNLFA
jgi:hypothetical protein